jgi:hypothetical protein
MARLSRIATRRYLQMDVAVGRHEKRYLRAALGDATAGSREETGSA